MKFLRWLLNVYDCAVCGKKVSGIWARTSKDLWAFASQKQKIDLHLDLRIKVEVRGLCGECFTSRAYPAVESVRDLFKGIVPERKKAAELSSESACCLGSKEEK